MPDTVDARIPLMAGQGVTPLIGANPNALMQLQQNAIRLQQQQQIQQGENALRELYRNPSNVDPSGNLNPEARNKLWQLSPAVAMDYTQNALRTMNMNSQLQYRQAETVKALNGEVEKARDAALNAYNDSIGKGMSHEAAQQRGQSIFSDKMGQLSSSGLVSLDQLNRLPKTFNPDEARASAFSPKERMQAEQKGWEVRTDYPPGRPPVQFNYNTISKQATDLRGNPYTPSGMAKPETAESSPYMVKVRGDNGEVTEVPARRGPDGRGYVTDDQKGEPLKNIVGSRKVGTKEDNESGSLDAATLGTMASQYLAGDRSVMQNIGRGAQGSKNVVALRAEIAKQAAEKGMSGPDIAAKMAEYDGMKAGMRTLGTRTANVEMAVTEAQQLAPLVLDASNKVNRTQFPLLNQVLQAGEKGVGDEDVVRFGISINSLINTYARAINPTGVSRVSDIEHARELLSTAWSKGQINAGVEQLMKEMEAARQSPGIVRGEMKGAISGTQKLPGGGAEAPIPGQPAQAQAPNPAAKMTPDAQGIYTLKQGDDWQQLPPNAYFRMPGDPPGKARLRP